MSSITKHSYPSCICENCPMTDYGCSPVGTGHWNLCEGRKCEEAYENYKEENPDDERTLEDMF